MLALIDQRTRALRSSTWFITFVVCYAIFVDQLFFAFILPVLPYSLPGRSGVPNEKVQYWTTVLIVVFGAACLLTCPITGWWTDRHASRRLPFFAGLLILIFSAILMWLAKPMPLQILSRVGQGAADAILYVVGMTILLDTVTIEHIAEYMGHVAIALNVGTFAGPLLGGVVFDRAGYHAVWWMMLGFVILDALLRLVMLEKTQTLQTGLGEHHLESVPDQELPSFGMGAGWACESAMTISSPPEGEQKSATTTISNTAADIQELSLDTPKRRSGLPALVTLLISVRMDVALYGVCVQSMIFSGFETVLSLYVQEIWNCTSLGAGLIFIPLTIPAFFAPLLGRIIDRTTPRWALVAGFLGLCPVLVGTQYVRSDAMDQKVTMCVLLVLIGLGITVALNPLMAEILYVVNDLEKRKASAKEAKTGYGGGAYAQAYALFAMAWSLGNITGPLMCGLIKDKAGWGTMCWTLALLSGTTAIPCFIWSGNGCKTWRSRADSNMTTC